MKIALYQGPSPAGDVAAARSRIERVVAAAASGGASLALFPELFLPGYNAAATIRECAEPADGPFAHWLAGCARAAGCGIVTGFAERDGACLFNGALAVGADGRRLALHRKLQLFGAQERALFAAGDRYTLFRLEGRTIGLLICYDVEFPEHVRALARAGAQLILVPTAAMQPWAEVPGRLLPARALENAVVIAYANYCGREGELDYVGGSLVVGPDGAPLAAAGRAGEALLLVDLAAADAVPRALLSTQLDDLRPIGSPAA